MAIMSRPSTVSILLLHLFTFQAQALQVSPNSPCAAVCLDDPKQPVSDPTKSNTQGSDIVCSDSSYSSTVQGEKFKSCISCLQTSSFSESGENDQSWFLYNVRYAFDTCLFGFANATEPIPNTPCSLEPSCGHLQRALKDGDLDPTESTYGYCSADDNAVLGSGLSKCLNCLGDGNDTMYLNNFLNALQIACTQQPPSGTLIGIKGSVFSSSVVNATYPGYSQSNTSHKKGLSHEAIIGLAIGLTTVVAIIVSIVIVCFRKHRHLLRMQRLSSPLDSRFGAKNITSPNSGSYGNPYTRPTVKISQPFDADSLSSKERQVLGIERPSAKRDSSNSRTQGSANGWSDESSQRSNQLPPYTGPGIPIHQAYIPEPVPESPVTSIASSNNWEMSTYSSPEPTPKNIPQVLPPSLPQNQYSPAPPISQQQPSLKAPTRNSRSQSGQPSPPYVQRIETRLPPRSQVTLRSAAGIGSTLTSQKSPTESSGPSTGLDRRLDFELAERERRDRGVREKFSRRKKADLTPESAESQEQWPGAY